MIDKRCLACDLFQDDCTGSEASCGKWKRLDFDRAAPVEASSGVPMDVVRTCE